MEPDQVLDHQFYDATYTLLVAFHNDEPFYSPEEDLICEFSFKDNFDVEDLLECSICLFRVGWENSQDAIVRRTMDECAVISQEQHSQLHFKKGEVYGVKFPCNELPRDGKDYQFCFLWQTSVLGASQPFQFQEGESSGTEASDIEIIKEGDLEWWYEASVKQLQNSENEETVVVHNERTVLEETLGRVVEENAILKGWKKDAEAEIDGLRENLADVENQKLVIEKVLVEKSNKITEQSQELVEFRTSIRSYENKVESFVERESHMKDRIQTLEKQLGEAEEEVRELLNKVETEKGEETGQLVQVYEMKLANFREIFQELEKELADEKMEKDKLVEKHLQEKEEFEAEMQALYSKVKSTDERVLELSLEKEDLISKVLEENEFYASCMKEKDTAIKNLEEQVKEVKDLNENLCQSSERAIRELETRVTSTIKTLHGIEEERDQLRSQLLVYRQSSDTVNSLKSDLEVRKEKEKELSDAIDKLQEELLKETEKCQELKDKVGKSNGARHALKVAYAHVQKQNATLRAEKEEVVRMLHSVQKQLGGTPSSSIIDEQNKKIEDLKLRLCMGLNAYKEKFVECRKLSHEVQRLRKTKATKRPEVVSSTGEESTPWRSFSAALQPPSVIPAPDVTDVGSRQEIDEKTLLKDEVEKLKTENVKLQGESEALQREITELRRQLEDARVQQLAADRDRERNSCAQGRSVDSMSEYDKMKDLLTLEVRRLEDVVQAKDLEIKILKQRMSELNILTNTPHTPLPTFLEMKEKHKKNVEKLQEECEKYKKILVGVNKVIHGNSQNGDDSLTREDYVGDIKDEIRRPPMDDDAVVAAESIRSSSAHLTGKREKSSLENPSTFWREPHMSPIRDVRFPPQIYKSSSESVGSDKHVKAPLPGDDKKQKDRVSAMPPSPTQNFKYPWIYGNGGAPPMNSVPGNVLRRHPANARDKKNEEGRDSKNRSLRKHMEPVIRCPVCQQAFPPGYSDVAATKHVNAHFSG